jgi:hypothetical protein
MPYDNDPAKHEEMLPYIIEVATRMDDGANKRCRSRDAHVRRSADSLMAQKLWALVDHMEAGKPVLPIIQGD